ncbi:MAG: hypothetical protein PHH58_10140 [Rhodoferax sp.]|nr:hypothetical protein [Rhodoferax sp.]
MTTLSSLKWPILSDSWLRRLSWLVGGVAMLWLIGWLVVPPLLKSQLQGRLGEQLGRAVSVGEVNFKPWTLELTLLGVALARKMDATARGA